MGTYMVLSVKSLTRFAHAWVNIAYHDVAFKGLLWKLQCAVAMLTQKRTGKQILFFNAD
jgi:hypothetical protein